MAVINRVPKGLLSFFDAKTLGKTPANIEDEVSVSVNATDFYYADIPLEVEIATATPVVANAQATSIAIPQGETWLVYEIATRVTSLNAAATAVSFSLAYSIFANVASRIFYESKNESIAAIADSVSACQVWESGRLFSYGTIFEAFNQALPGGIGLRYDSTVAFRRLTT